MACRARIVTDTAQTPTARSTAPARTRVGRSRAGAGTGTGGDDIADEAIGTLRSPRATWRSGYAAACKAVYTGSIPVVAFRSIGD